MQSTSRTEQRCRLKRPHAGRDAAERVLRLWARTGHNPGPSSKFRHCYWWKLLYSRKYCTISTDPGNPTTAQSHSLHSIPLPYPILDW